MKTTYHYKGGQFVRQMQDCGIHTSESWCTDLDNIKRNIKGWSYYPNKIRFKLINDKQK